MKKFKCLDIISKESQIEQSGQLHEDHNLSLPMHNLNTTEVTQWYNGCQFHLCYQDNKLVSSDGSDQI